MRILSVVLATLLTTGCGDDPLETPTSSSSTAVTPTTITFAGTLAVGASRFYSFTAINSGSVRVMLASVASPTGGIPLAATLGVGVGVPSGTGCALAQSVSAQPGLTVQLDHTITPGVHCVVVFDEGTLTTPVNFAIRFSHP
jgi:hypothetical protein